MKESKMNACPRCGESNWKVYCVEIGGILLNQQQTNELSGWERICRQCGEIQKAVKR